MPRYKTPEDYEHEALKVGECLLHPSHGAARRCYEKRHGKLPRHLYVCHTCDNGWCVKDEHHFAGTQKENLADAHQKGRLVRSLEVREKMSQSAKKYCASLSKEELSERSKHGQANKTPEEQRAKILRGWAHLTPEERSLRNARNAQKIPPEARIQRSIQANAKLSPEERSERSRKAYETRRRNLGQQKKVTK